MMKWLGKAVLAALLIVGGAVVFMGDGPPPAPPAKVADSKVGGLVDAAADEMIGPDTRLTGVTRRQAVGAAALAWERGWPCTTIASAQQSLSGAGWLVRCDGGRHSYLVRQEGGRLLIERNH